MVYKAMDDMGNVRAIKISNDLFSITNEYNGMMKLEGYPFVPKVYDFDDFKMNNKIYHFIVMDYIDGQNLRKIRDNKNLNLKNVLKIGKVLVKIMEKISQLGYKYTDIKMDNVIVDRKGKVYIVDFGSLVETSKITKEYTPAYNINSWNLEYKYSPTTASLFSITMIMVSLISGREYNPMKRNLDYIIGDIKGFSIPNRVKSFLIDGLKGNFSDYHQYYRSLSSFFIEKEDRISMRKIDYLLIISVVSFVFILILGIKSILC